MILRTAARLSTSIYRFTAVRQVSLKWIEFTQKKNTVQVFQTYSFATKKSEGNMVDPKRVISYEDMLNNIHKPEKVIIDVRNPDEVKSTGKIPSSINIPLPDVQDALNSMTEQEFQKNYQRNKPSSSDELIFYCHSGRRSSEALDRALKLGYTNSKTYLGSWSEWSTKNK